MHARKCDARSNLIVRVPACRAGAQPVKDSATRDEVIDAARSPRVDVTVGARNNAVTAGDGGSHHSTPIPCRLLRAAYAARLSASCFGCTPIL